MTPCLEWARPEKNGYARRKIRGRMVLVHRHAWEQAHGPIPEGMVVMHICDNRACYALDHLRLGTQAENIADKVAKGRQARGTKVYLSKLTEDQVREIYASTAPCAELVSKYGINQSSVSAIRTGRTWKHVTTHQGEK